MDIALAHLSWILFILTPFPASAQNSSTISLGTSLTTNQSIPWLSPSGEFAFGFRPLEGRNGFLLAIWFNNITQNTIVWSAKGVNSVEEGSKVNLTANGELLLIDHRGREIWKANASSAATSAAMLDSGNFVLTGRGSDYLWESFKDPTDTLLPGQMLGRSGVLSSRESEHNYSRGRFQLRLQDDGNLVLNTIALPRSNSYGAYWQSNTAGNDTRLIFNKTGYIYLVLQNISRFNLSAEENLNPVSTTGFYQRATLDFDGVFRQYVYPKNNSSSKERWGESWHTIMSVPRDICMAKIVDIGSGVCGFNSYCKLDENLKPSCHCPIGYTESSTFNGCREDFLPQSCDGDGSIEVPLFKMEYMPNTNWPLSDYEHYDSMDENECREACLQDCLCAVAIFGASGCWKKKLPLSNGQMDPSIGGKALIKVRIANSTSSPRHEPPGSGREKKDQGTIILIISVLLGSSGFLNFLLLSAIIMAIHFSYGKKAVKHKAGSSLIGMKLPSFSYKELEEITNGFKEELGRGSCGTVYRGTIASDSINFVAVKKLDRVLKEAEKEFTAEVNSISQIHHKNLVQLLGYCDEGANRLLVYEFMSNGSLANFLFSNPRPDWNQRAQIAFGIARGLMYLHEECGIQIIHCDIKPQNILLDDCFTAKISDFGLAKLLMTSQTQTTTSIKGTKGYAAPEWFNNKPITAKVDVYSFGVLLLEIICCRRSIEPDLEEEGNDILIDWACECYKEGRLDLMVESDEETALIDARRLERMVMVAIWCIQEEPSLRPSMRKVTQMLEGAVEIPVPPDPFSFMSSLE